MSDSTDSTPLCNKETIWVRHSWDLTSLQISESPPPGYEFEAATPNKLHEVIGVVLAAYESDPVWGKIIDEIAARITQRISTTIGTAGCKYLVAKFGDQVVAVSGIAATHWTEQNLLTGICTLPAHQRKGAREAFTCTLVTRAAADWPYSCSGVHRSRLSRRS